MLVIQFELILKIGLQRRQLQEKMNYQKSILTIITTSMVKVVSKH
jgi:hypothetical protein